MIDEHSVISCGMLHWIDERLREIWPHCSHLPFGGRDVIIAGDAGQLAPVSSTPLYTTLNQINDPIERKGRDTWKNMDFVCKLMSQNRGKTDPEYFDALRRLREKSATEQDVALFNTRLLNEKNPPEWMPLATHIAYRNVDVDEANRQSIRRSSEQILAITAKHEVHPKGLQHTRPIPEQTVTTLLKNANEPHAQHDRVLRPYLELARDAPVTLTFNLEQKAGLCNGSKGIIYDFIPLPNSNIPIVLVQMCGKYIGPSFIPNAPAIVPIIPKK